MCSRQNLYRVNAGEKFPNEGSLSPATTVAFKDVVLISTNFNSPAVFEDVGNAVRDLTSPNPNEVENRINELNELDNNRGISDGKKNK